MNALSKRLEQLLTSGADYFKGTDEDEFSKKPSADKWSKKEILGHLIDSGINNLQRFTEIQFQDKPYPIRQYDQDALVIANGYQQAGTTELCACWLAINQRIQHIVQQQTTTSLAYPIVLPSGKAADLHFLITDYVDHLEHHLKQIVN